MNLKTKDLRNIETIDPEDEAAVSSGQSANGSEVPLCGSQSGAIAGKSRGMFRPAFVITGVALCMGLGSCVGPYDTYGGGHATTYRPGYRVNTLPGGYRSETISGRNYYYHDGYYYRQGSGGYVVVDAPRNSRYYDDYRRRQRAHQTRGVSSDRHDRRYERGEVITRLPDGHRVVNHRGDTYYRAGDRYYRRQGDHYVVATRPY